MTEHRYPRSLQEGQHGEDSWTALLDEVSAASARFDEAADNARARLGERRVAFGHWSLADVLAHLVAWDLEAARRFEQFLAGPTPDRTYDVDAFNAAEVEARHRSSWEDLLAEHAQAQRRLRTVASRTTLEDREREPRFVEWLKSLREHYAHHAARVERA